MRKSKILITCPKGIPPFLKQELTALKFPVLSEHVAAVGTEGTFDDSLRLNLRLRTAHRVLVELQEFGATKRRRTLRTDRGNRLGSATFPRTAMSA